MSNEFEQVYIGDGVYAQWDGFAVKLTTERETTVRTSFTWSLTISKG